MFQLYALVVSHSNLLCALVVVCSYMYWGMYQLYVLVTSCIY